MTTKDRIESAARQYEGLYGPIDLDGDDPAEVRDMVAAVEGLTTKERVALGPLVAAVLAEMMEDGRLRS